jgi:hypothetical protein
MDLDRGTLARIDRKMLSGLDHEESWQMVRVPVSDAMWSTWRRYCGALGVSMGRVVLVSSLPTSSALFQMWTPMVERCSRRSWSADLLPGLRTSTSENNVWTSESGR